MSICCQRCACLQQEMERRLLYGCFVIKLRILLHVIRERHLANYSFSTETDFHLLQGHVLFLAMIVVGNAKKKKLQGKGYGDYYQIKCSREPRCSKNPIRVSIIDQCLGAYNNVPFHFDLSRIAFGAMVNPRSDDNIRNLGQVDIQYQRVTCYFGRTKMASFLVVEKVS